MAKNRKTSGSGGSSPSFEERRIEAGDDPQKIADLYGFTFTEGEDGEWNFYDENNDFTLTISYKAVDEAMDYPYMLNRYVEIASKLPDMNRKVTPALYIVESLGNSQNFGLHLASHHKYTKEQLSHGVAISSYAFAGDDDDVLRTMLHETNHAYDWMMADSKSRSGISYSKEFKAALKKEGSATAYSDSYRYKRSKNGITGEYSNTTLYRKNSKYLLENYAEAGSIVQMKKLGYDSHEIETADGNYITVNEWVDTHPEMYKVVSSAIDNFSENNYVKDLDKNMFDDGINDYFVNL